MVSEDVGEPVQIPWLGHLKEHWRWTAPLFYVYLCGVGMLDSWQRFGAFGIRIFEFSEPTDFIVSAFREPILVETLALLVVLGLSLLISLGIVEHIRVPSSLSRRFPQTISAVLERIRFGWMLFGAQI